MKDIDQIRRDNIRILEKEAGGLAALAKRIGMSDSQCQNLRDGAKDSKTGKPRGMRKETAWRFEDSMGKPRGWLDQEHELSPSPDSENDNGVPEFLLKKGEEMKTNVVDMASRRLPMPSGVVRFERLPVSMSAGPGAAEEVYGLDAVEYLDVAEAWAREQVGSCDPKRIKVVTCRGDSMSPTIPNGSLLFVDVTIRRHVGDGVYALAIGDRLLVKRVNMLTKSRAFEVISDSPNGPATEVYQAHEEQQLNICGRVVAWWSLHRNV